MKVLLACALKMLVISVLFQSDISGGFRGNGGNQVGKVINVLVSLIITVQCPNSY